MKKIMLPIMIGKECTILNLNMKNPELSAAAVEFELELGFELEHLGFETTVTADIDPAEKDHPDLVLALVFAVAVAVIL